MAQDDDEPRSKKRHRDEDDDYDDVGAVRKPRPKKRGMSTGMLIGVLVVGGLMLVVACGGCGGLGFWAYTIYGKSPIVGTWEDTTVNILGVKQQYTFQADGRGHQKLANIQVNFKYRFKEELLEIEPDGEIPGLKGINRAQRFRVSFQGDDMVWTNIDNQPLLPREQRFRRVN